jgi:hypothetical protein
MLNGVSKDKKLVFRKVIMAMDTKCPCGKTTKAGCGVFKEGYGSSSIRYCQGCKQIMEKKARRH